MKCGGWAMVVVMVVVVVVEGWSPYKESPTLSPEGPQTVGSQVSYGSPVRLRSHRHSQPRHSHSSSPSKLLHTYSSSSSSFSKPQTFSSSSSYSPVASSFNILQTSSSYSSSNLPQSSSSFSFPLTSSKVPLEKHSPPNLSLDTQASQNSPSAINEVQPLASPQDSYSKPRNSLQLGMSEAEEDGGRRIGRGAGIIEGGGRGEATGGIERRGDNGERREGGAGAEELGVGGNGGSVGGLGGGRCSQKQQESSKESHSRFVTNYLTKPFDKLQTNITIGLLSSFKFSKLALGALPVAVEDVNRDPHLLPGRRLEYQVADVGHSGSDALAALSIRRMTMMRDAGLLAFIGPDDNCANEALVAAAWNLPMITYRCGDHHVGNKTKYYTVARTTPPATKIVKALISLMLEYKWKQFVLLTEQATTFEQISDAVQSFAQHHGMRLIAQYSVPYDYTTRRYNDMQKLVHRSLQQTRVYVVVASYEVQWDLVLALREGAGPLLSHYVVLTIDDEKYLGTNTSHGMRMPGKQAVDMSEEVTDRIYHGFRAVLKITPTHPTNSKYRKFERKVLNRIKQHPFCLPYNPSVYRYIEVPIFAAHLYDAVMMYAQVLNDTLADPTADPANGTHILSLIRNRSFQSIQGPKVHMDENGDAEGTYSLLRVARLGPLHSPPLAWRQVGQFQFHDRPPTSHPKDNLPTLKLQSPIPWLGEKPPRDEPPCGFRQEKCHYDWYPLVIGLVVSLVIMVAALFLVRHYRYEHKLACLLWKIDMREVKIINPEICAAPDNHTNNNTIPVTRQSVRGGGGSGGNSGGGRGRQANGGLGEVTCEVPRVAYCPMGVYRGNLVALKYVKRRSVDLTRAIRKELKQMREVRHENLAVFVGACVEAGGVVVLTTYCARGSLHDVLLNDDLPQDDLFGASLVADLIKAMIFLHDSEIVSHGRLRSSNCLVDSRWVLQVTDYGLHEFKATAEQEVDSRKRLWTAPELLQDPSAHPRGTQKGDVYSFGIILYEVVGRKGPWGPLLQKLGTQEILRQVCAEGLRPPLEGIKAAECVVGCLRECWNPLPEERPDFKGVRLKLKEMQAGLKLNIVDNMLAMLEKYAYNLEGKVQERTKQLLEEKKKTEILLLRMLPKSVAESLKRGEQVSPESYDNVTIYFSDIVGFTLLSAHSTPLQMVDMLNELYTCFDAIIGYYDVYKVETIGDAYMVVSGLPISNGDRHAAEIASMALKLLSAAKVFRIRHRPGDTLKLRIGIHSGPCVAGVVGLTMPRYCLFGDTVNTASRMESTGEELRIHTSQAHKDMLEKLGGYVLVKRGLTYVKGKGQMMTWWLVGEAKEGEESQAATPTTTPTTASTPTTPTTTTTLTPTNCTVAPTSTPTTPTIQLSPSFKSGYRNGPTHPTSPHSNHPSQSPHSPHASHQTQSPRASHSPLPWSPRSPHPIYPSLSPSQSPHSPLANHHSHSPIPHSSQCTHPCHSPILNTPSSPTPSSSHYPSSSQ